MPKKEDVDDFIGPTEASHILRSTPDTVRNYSRRKLLDAIPLNGGTRHVYRRADVERLAAERRKGPKTSKAGA